MPIQQTGDCRLHEALIRQTQGERLVGHIARDSTAIKRGVRPHRPKPPQAPVPAKKRGRPKKDKRRPEKQSHRIEKQAAGLPARAGWGRLRIGARG